MKIALLFALGTCLWAVWPLRSEVPGLWPYLLAQTLWAATAFTARLWVDTGSTLYLQVHSSFAVFALGCALWMASAMLTGYDARVVFLALAAAGPVACCLPLLMGAHLATRYGGLPIHTQLTLFTAGALLFCGVVSLLTLAPPTLPPFVTQVRIICGVLWILLAVWKLSYAVGMATHNADRWEQHNGWTPLAIEACAFALLTLFALHAERGPIGTVAPQAELAAAQQAANAYRVER